MELLVYALVFYFGMIAGYLVQGFIHRKKAYAGTLRVVETEGKTSYLLELDRDPAELGNKKEISFKVRSSMEESSLSQ